MKRKIYKFLSGAKHGVLALALTAFSGTAYSQMTFTFSYTGGVQTMNLQAGTYSVQCWGADGGDNMAAGTGGKGGYSSGTITVVAPGPHYIYIGGKGITGTGGSGSAPGGFNGGGDAGAYTGSSYGMGSGGGATHIASATGLLSSLSGNQSAVYIVAAGGGGSGSNHGPTNTMNLGGNGGGLVGADGLTGNYGGTGGTQTAGGTGVVQNGSFGQGGNNSGNNTGGGGGGGWYGGGAAQWEGSGGGSGYIGGVTNGVTIEYGQPGFVPNPDASGNGYMLLTSLCDVNVSASSNPMCFGDQIVLSTNAGSGISWSTGANTQSITVSPTSNTSYTVTGVSSSTSGCINTLVVSVTVNPLPNVAATGVPSVVCVGSTATLNAYGAGTYTWSNSLTGWTTTVAPPVTSVYTVTGTDGNGCKNQGTVEVTVNTNSLNVTPPVTLCSGSSQSLTASGGASSTSYTWFPQANFPTIIVSPTVTTTYVVAATDIHNCLITGSVEVTVADRPNIIAGVDRDQICRGESVTLSASGGDNYTWSNGLTGPTNTVQLNADVTYTFAVTGSNSDGCTGTGTTAVVVERCTGVNESSAVGLMSISPNPSAGIFQLAFEEKEPRNIRVTDLTGKVIFEKQSAGTETVLDLSGYPAGVYSVQVTSSGSIFTHKLIIQ